jgi:hypothetical protein
MAAAMTILERTTLAITLVLLCAMVFTTGAQVASRYVLDLPLIWTEETGRHLMIWMVFLASTVIYRRGQHIAIDLFGARLGPPRTRRDRHRDRAAARLLLLPHGALRLGADHADHEPALERLALSDGLCLRRPAGERRAAAALRHREPVQAPAGAAPWRSCHCVGRARRYR